MKVIIAGSRNIPKDINLDDVVALSKFTIEEVVCGMARGADMFAFAWATSKGIPVKQFPADWDRFGKVAGPYRNKEMANYGDALIALWDGESSGTFNMIQNMKFLQKPVFVFKFK